MSFPSPAARSVRSPLGSQPCLVSGFSHTTFLPSGLGFWVSSWEAYPFSACQVVLLQNFFLFPEPWSRITPLPAMATALYLPFSSHLRHYISF